MAVTDYRLVVNAGRHTVINVPFSDPGWSALRITMRGGLVLREGDGQVRTYQWPKVAASTRRSPDMPPWGTGEIFLQLSGDDGRHLGTLIGADKHELVQKLMSGMGDGRR
ncbi:hypothetical protein [Actinomadura madurae]|uniref:hypothetical protein n=1 Tax=Actinomadura madurae TaxID=1993 RepID=UPI000D876B2F|nr:hypothetical protein [Actinomadura madurae]SPT51262.1 Uncharacterised protein [Actinomadura madurae]